MNIKLYIKVNGEWVEVPSMEYRFIMPPPITLNSGDVLKMQTHFVILDVRGEIINHVFPRFDDEEE